MTYEVTLKLIKKQFKSPINPPHPTTASIVIIIVREELYSSL